MGLLRLFLALTVVNWHWHYSDWPIFPFSFEAVCCFFIISGFYMSLVLNEKYRNNLLGFYAGRAIRLYPMYFVTLALFYLAGAHGLISYFQPVLASRTLLGWIIEIVREALIVPGVLQQQVTLFGTPTRLPIGPMSTVGLELMFYAIAPFIVCRRLRVLLPFSAAAIALHFAMLWVGPARPWQYEFFPGILGFFMLGALSYRIWRWARSKRYPKWLGWAMLPLFLVFSAWPEPLSAVEFTDNVQADAFYVGFALLLPFLFEASKNTKWDGAIGELSYPVYVVHWLLGWAIVGVPDWAHGRLYPVVPAASILAAIALLVLVDRPVRAWRTRAKRNHRERMAFTLDPLDSGRST